MLLSASAKKLEFITFLFATLGVALPSALASESGESTADNQAVFHVDPTAGNDTNDGLTFETAFRTLENARQVVDSVNDNMAGDIVVELHGGTFRPQNTLALDSGDSGSNGFRVIYRAAAGETPVVSGGLDLSGGWVLTKPTSGIYRKSGVSSNFRQLYINGQAGVRARMPNKTNDRTLGSYYKVKSASSSNQQIKIEASKISSWSGLTSVEMVMMPHWYHYRSRISSFTVSDGNAYVTFQDPEQGFLFAKGDSFWPNAPYYFENSIDFLDAAGEWFHDTTTGDLYYIPRPGENLATATVEAGVLETLVSFSGTSASDIISNISFQNVTFAHSGWISPSEQGASMTQATREVSGAIKTGAVTARYAEALELDGCTFKNIGSNAISMDKGVSDSIIHNCMIHRIAGNGIVVHDDGVKNLAPGDACANIKILNNRISRVGQEYSNGIGIVSYFVNRLLVADNEICHSPYMATQTGGQSGGFVDVGMKDNIFRNNYVHHVMQLHDDGGAFYTLSRQQGTHVVDNFSSSLQASKLTGNWPVAGLYADNNSEFITFEHNATVDSTQAIFYPSRSRHCNFISNITSADPSIVNYAGNKADYFLPLKAEAELMTLDSMTVTNGSAYSNDKGAICESGTGTAETVFTGVDGSYNLHVAYLAEPTTSASFRLLADGVEVGAWASATTPADTGLQIRHFITRGVPLKQGEVLRIECTAGAGSAARIDYLEVYRHQLQKAPEAPTQLTATVHGYGNSKLAWEPSTGAHSYTIKRASSADGPYNVIATGVTSPFFLDSDTFSNQTLYFKVAAVNASGEGSSDEYVTLFLPPTPPRKTLDATSDAYIQRGTPDTNYGDAGTLVVKNAPTTSIHRKGYLKFDLSGASLNTTPLAELQFAVSSWTAGSTWLVYGLNDGDAEESWDEATITWNNAPANTTSSATALDSARVTSLGSLAVTEAQVSGEILSFSSEALDTFLLADADGQVSFILTRSTSGDSINTSIASREHPSLSAPRLKFSTPTNNLKIEDIGFNGPTLDITITGLDPLEQYIVTRSPDLTSFDTVIGHPFTSASGIIHLSDPSPPLADQSFYRVEKFTP
ncbi:DNRLRE domain-containing protein [Verrucomicrobiaceae bacterium N1E253]|uniref:DNRLRE domain-containing protein n=1 Tax=Oceaniferula marina TaxID=2748318 RepID=A0A851GH85_9BACT|nr:DNRLRE domain-containing protein [Oceaniferula marina]NWK56559.1 DNRLRE domain-containing protein [Oceaniferula marina]